MKDCKNIPEGQKTVRYSGNENTPLGRGYSARYVEKGKRMKGVDGFYVSNGQRWVKVKSKSKKSEKKN